MSTFRRSVTIDAPVASVFAFHLDTRNARAIAPRGQRIEVVEGEFPLVVGAEVALAVRQRPLPFAQHWRVRVTDLVPPRLLVDELVEGPFRRFRHEHRFEGLGEARTRLTDRIDYELPLGPLGRLADRVLVARIVRRVFAARQEATARVLGAAAREERAPTA